MLNLTDKQIADYFRRSYTSADGLWFMKLEERYGFDTALDLDDEVWKVVPKIQARLLKAMGNLGDGLEALQEGVTTRLSLDDFIFEAEKVKDGRGFKIVITRCPWHELMIKSGRVHLSGKVGTRICNTEYSVLASEFGGNMSFELQEQICEGGKCCTMVFRDGEK